MNDDAAGEEHQQPEVPSRQPITMQALEHEEADLDIASELAEYFPEHLCDFYEILKTDYQEIRRASQITFYETRIMIWLCVLAGILISFKTSLVGGSIVSVASVVVGIMNKFIKVRDKPRDDLEKRLEAMRLTVLDIERICLRVRLADAISDAEQKNDVLARLAEDEHFQRQRAPQHPPTPMRRPPVSP